MALGTVLLAVPACTDTWDDHYNSTGTATDPTKTLWEEISTNPNYSRFKDIVQKAKYYKDNTHAVPTYSFEDILNGGQVNTVWVPDNSVLSEAEYQKWLEMCETDGYNVQQQFLGNHIALFRHNISVPNVIDTVKMINGKNLIFDMTDPANSSLQGIKIGDKYNVATANGVLHSLNGIAPFHYNFYEQLKFTEPMTELGKYVVSKDTTYFSTDLSIEGLPDENGNPTYVDSVYFTSNRLFSSTHYLPNSGADKWQMTDNGFGANINAEDSVFIMLMPTDAAWNSAYEKLKSAYVYAANYDDKVKGDVGTKTTIKGLDPDSLQKMSLQMDIVSPLVFNIHKQPKQKGAELWKVEDFIKTGGAGIEYLLNTYGDTLRNTKTWNTTDLFNCEPVQMSNGYAYMVNSLEFPKEYLTPDVEVEIESESNFYYPSNNNNYKVGTGSKRHTFSNSTYRDITNLYGTVSNNNFYFLNATGATSGPKVEIKLKGNSATAYVPDAQVMSGKYDIQVVLVPYWYMNIVNAGGISNKFYKLDTITWEQDPTLDPFDTIFVRRKGEIDTTYVKSLAAVNKCKITATLTYNNKGTEKSKESLVKNYEYDGLKVDTVTLKEGFEFPTSYKNMRFSYPVLYLECSTGKNDQKNGFIFDLLIDKVILKRCDDSQQTTE